MCAAMAGKEIAIGDVVILRKEGLLQTVPALCHMMRSAGQDKAGNTDHRIPLTRWKRCVN